MKYDAFISYSHAVDGKLAPALQQTLHRLAKPWYKRKMLKLFRDETSLSVTPHLWDTIEQALSDSKHLILLASPESAQSEWVNKEVEYWLNHKSINTLLIGLTDGEILWKNKSKDFDWSVTNALPLSLQGKFRQEPLFVDLRNIRTRAGLSIGNPEFKKKAAIIAATLHDKPVEDLIGEDIEQFRRNIRLRNGVIIALTVLLFISTLASWWAFNRTAFAQERQRFAEMQQQIASDSARVAREQRTRAEVNAQMARDSAAYARFQEAIAKEQQQIAEYQRNLAILAQRDAENQRGIAETQRDSARLERDIAEANRLAALATIVKERNPNLAIRIAEQSYEKVEPPLSNAAQAISAAYFEYFDSKIVPHEAEINLEDFGRGRLHLSTDGKKVIYTNGKVNLYDIPTKKVKLLPSKNERFIYSEENGFIITFPVWGQNNPQPAQIWNEAGELIREIQPEGQPIRNIFYFPSTNKLLILSDSKKIYLTTPPLCKEMQLLGQPDHIYELCDDADALECPVSRGQFFFTRQGNDLAVWSTSGKKYMTVSNREGMAPSLMAVSFDEENMVFSRGNRLEVFSLTDSHQAVLENSIEVEYDDWDIAFSKKGKYIIGTHKAGAAGRDIFGNLRTWLFVKVWNLDGKLLKNIRYDVARDQRVTTSPDDEYLLVQTTNGYSITSKANENSYSPWDNEYITIYKIEGLDMPIKTISAFNQDYATPKAEFLSNQEIVFLASEKRLEILDFVRNLSKTSLVHDRPITHFTIDYERQILISKDDENVKFWNFEGELLLRALGDKGSQMTYTVAGDYLLTHSNTTKLWRVSTRIAREFRHPGDIQGVVLSADNKRIITFNRSSAKVWGLEGKVYAALNSDATIDGISFLPDSYRFIVWGDFKIRLYREDGVLLKEKDLHSEEMDSYAVKGVAFSRNGKWFLTADSFGRILVWNTQVFNFFQGCKIANGNFLSRAPDSDILVIGPTLFRNISMPLDTINLSLDYALWNMVEFQPAQERLIFPNRQEAVVYNYEGKAIKRFSGHGALVLGGLFNPTNPDQALTYTENSIHIWDISSGEERVKIDAAHYGGLSTVLWAANGNIIALTKSDEIPFVIWNGNGKLIKEDNSHRGFIKNIALAPDKKYFITSSGKNPMESPFELPDLYGGWMTEDIDYTVKLWTADGALLADFDKNLSEVTALGFLENGDWVYVGTANGKLKLFPVPRKINAWLKSGSPIPVLKEEEKRRYGIR